MSAPLKLTLDALNQIILGKELQIKLALSCLLAKGHLLIEDLPGMGKTTLAHALAKALGLKFQRVQFTSDLLPADIIGSAIYRRSNEEFQFHPGPIFSQVLLADEINRATPKSQSALLEAMEEYQVTVEGVSRSLPKPFFVIATQNPFHQVGTYPLPESQLDRFLIRISLGYPAPESERQLLLGQDTRQQIEQLQQILTLEQLLDVQQQVEQVLVSEKLLDYVQALIAATRESSHWTHGLSPRAGLALLRAAKAWALLSARDYVLPEDVQTVWEPVVGHRLASQTGADRHRMSGVVEVLENTPIPR